MPTGYRMLPGGDLEKINGSITYQLTLKDFIVEPSEVRPGSVYIQGSETPRLNTRIVGAVAAAHVEQAWLDGDDELVREFLSK